MACLNVFAFGYGLLRDVVRYGVCVVLFVFMLLCGLCVIECAVVYGLLLLTVCARVDLK